MATCILCQKKGFLLTVDRKGVCDNCQAIHYPQIERTLEIYVQSTDLINSSKNFKTKYSRIDDVERCLETLYEYEQQGVREIFSKDVKSLMDGIPRLREEVVEEEAERIYSESLQKFELAKTSASKITAANRGIVKLTELERDTIGCNAISEYVQKLKNEVYKAELGKFIDAAKKWEFKENYKKALDQYQEALYYIRTDEYDDSLQTNIIKQIESKIVDMKNRIANP